MGCSNIYAHKDSKEINFSLETTWNIFIASKIHIIPLAKKILIIVAYYPTKNAVAFCLQAYSVNTVVNRFLFNPRFSCYEIYRVMNFYETWF